MNSLYKICCVVVLVFLANEVGAQESKYTLEELMDAAERHYPKSDAAELYTAIERTDLALARAGLGPKVSLNAKASWQSDVTSIDLDFPPTLPFTSEDLNFPNPPQDNYKINLDILQPIYQGGAIKVKKHAARIDHEIANKSLDAEISQRRRQVAMLFFTVRQLQYSGEITQAYIQDLKLRLENVQSGVQNGMILQAEADILKAEITRLEQQQLEIQSAIRKTEQSLILLTGIENLAVDKLTEPQIEMQENNALQRSELQLFDLNIEKLSNTEKLISTTEFPGVSGFGQLGYGRPGLNMFDEDFAPYAIVGVQMNWLLWDNKARNNQKDVLKVRRQLLDLEKSSFEQNIQLSLSAAQEDALRYEQLIQSDNEAIALRERVTKAYAAQLDNGAITTSEYLRQANEEQRARLQREANKVMLMKTRAEIRFITGQW